MSASVFSTLSFFFLYYVSFDRFFSSSLLYIDVRTFPFSYFIGMSAVSSPPFSNTCIVIVTRFLQCLLFKRRRGVASDYASESSSLSVENNNVTSIAVTVLFLLSWKDIIFAFVKELSLFRFFFFFFSLFQASFHSFFFFFSFQCILPTRC